MTKITAMVIASNYPDNLQVSGSDDGTGKWVGFIYLLKDGSIHSLLISSSPSYNNEGEAVEAMHNVCKYCQENI